MNHKGDEDDASSHNQSIITKNNVEEEKSSLSHSMKQSNRDSLIEVGEIQR
jgi:hypothetical protein